MGKQLRGICFNFGGVLVDSFPAEHRLVCEVFDIFELRKPGYDEYCCDPEHALLPYFLEFKPVPQKKHEYWFAEFGIDLKPDFFPEVSYVLGTLYDAGIPMWLLSNNPADQVYDRCKELGIGHFFKQICTGPFETTHMLERFCNEEGLYCSEVAMVGGTPNELVAASNVGVRAIWRRTYSEAISMLGMCGVDYCIESLRDLLRFVVEQEHPDVTYEIRVRSCSKLNGGGTGKKFTILKRNGSGEPQKFTGKGCTFSHARKEIARHVPSHLLASTKVNPNGTTVITA